uniref:Pentacotripeptide-repeat region of PRORP domain-containing protein n=1 Tax=Globisporangium ultimum (strain ATCC 200006 / CBS 805.95 / DAOM BR144) TaxID=431595 RepID=K3WM39_GLOUD
MSSELMRLLKRSPLALRLVRAAAQSVSAAARPQASAGAAHAHVNLRFAAPARSSSFLQQHTQKLREFSSSTRRSGVNISRNGAALQKESVSAENFDELKQFLMEPATDGEMMQRVKAIVAEMMQQHVFPSMPGQEATVMAMVADAMKDYTFVLDVYACLRDAYVSPSPLTLELAASACAQLGDWKTAAEVVEFMHQAIDVMHPSTDIYENAIVACYRANKWMKAKQFLDEMQTYGLEATPEIHMQCMSLCIASNELTATKKLLENYLQTFDFEPEELEESLHKLLGVAFEAQSLDHALFLRDQLVNRGFAFSKELYAGVINLSAHQRKWYRARVLLSQYVGERSTPPTAAKSSQYTNDIRKLLDEMIRNEFEIPLSVYNAALRNYGQLGKNEDASYVFASMKQRGVEPDAVSYAAAMAACGTNVVESAHLFQEMQSRGCKPTMDAYHAYLLAPSRATQWQEVLDRYNAIPSTDKQQVDEDARILSLVAVAYGRMKQNKNMLQVFTNMKVRGLRPNLYVYGEAMYAYIHLGQWRHALLLFDHIRQEGFEHRKLAGFSMIWDAAVLAAVTGEQADRAALLYTTITSLNATISPASAELLIDTLQDVPVATLWNSFKSMQHLHRVRRHPARSNPKVLNALLKRAVDERDVYFAEKLVAQGEDEMDMTLNSMTYSLMLRLYATKENPGRFHAWCTKMADANVKSTLFTYRAVLQHLNTLSIECEDPSYLQSINELLGLKLDGPDAQHVERIAVMILDAMEARDFAPDALCFEYFLRLSQDDPVHATRILSVLESADGFHFSTNFLHSLFVALGNHPDQVRVRDFLIKCLEELPRSLSDDALAAYCSSTSFENLVILVESLASVDYELEDNQVVLLLVAAAPSDPTEDSDDDGGALRSVPAIYMDSDGNLPRIATLLQDADVVLESSSMAFLLQQIIGLAKSPRHNDAAIAEDRKAMEALLVHAFRHFSKSQVHEFLSQVVQKADFTHIESVLSALDEH